MQIYRENKQRTSKELFWSHILLRPYRNVVAVVKAVQEETEITEWLEDGLRLDVLVSFFLFASW